MGFSAVITDLLCLRSECKQPSPRATSALTFLHKTQFCMETDASKINVQSLFGFNKEIPVLMKHVLWSPSDTKAQQKYHTINSTLGY